MPAATYVSVLVRAHLRSFSPLPKDELLALKRSIAELGAIGRNINQIAKVANEGGGLPGSVREEFRAMLKICEALRENTKALLKANLDQLERRAYGVCGNESSMDVSSTENFLQSCEANRSVLYRIVAAVSWCCP